MENILSTLGIALLVFGSKEIIQWVRRKFGMIDKNVSKQTHDEAMTKIRGDFKEDVKLIHKRISDTRDKTLTDSKEHANELFERSEEKRQSGNELMMQKLDSNQELFTTQIKGLETLIKQALNTKSNA